MLVLAILPGALALAHGDGKIGRRAVLAGGLALPPWAGATSPSIPARESCFYSENSCHLNTYMLLASLRDLGTRASAVVTPESWLWRQRLGAREGLRRYDFHVFAVVDAAREVLDLDSDLAWPTPGRVWVADALRPARAVDADARRRVFRVIPGDEYLANARTAGPAANFESAFVDMRARGYGSVLDEVALARMLSR